jgi:hypothetical protein
MKKEIDDRLSVLQYCNFYKKSGSMELSLIVTTETIEPLEIVTDRFFVLTKGLSATRAIQ